MKRAILIGILLFIYGVLFGFMAGSAWGKECLIFY